MKLEAVTSKAQLVLGIVLCLWLVVICSFGTIYGGVLLYSNLFAIDANEKLFQTKNKPLLSASQPRVDEHAIMVKTLWFDRLAAPLDLALPGEACGEHAGQEGDTVDVGGKAFSEGDPEAESWSNENMPIKRRVYTKTKLRVIGASTTGQSFSCTAG